ncbi:MAG: serine/threonine protein kinase [Chloroflexi bacterium]|nr:serine/threonine protein kinase [Chloroflexota bacterium]
MHDLVGQTFGEYRLRSFLGSGNFADVYEAEHIYLKTSVAVKLLRGAFTEQDMEDFRNEARLLVDLVHNHIVRVFTFNVERDIPYLVMSYAPNGSLNKLHPRGTTLPLSTIVSYVNQIADALQYAHKHGVIHRDINPANLLLGNDGQVLVADFGIAELAVRTGSSRRQKVAGTPRYMAPEQFEGYAVPASDQYALGIVVYQWLCGESPFIGKELPLAYQHKTVSPPPLREKISVLPALEAVVLRALAKDPQRRFPTIQDFARELEQAYTEDQTYTEETKRLFDTPERLVEVLTQESTQRRLLDLITTDQDWWHNIGQAVFSDLRSQAVQGSRTDVTAVLSAFAQRVAGEASIAIKRGEMPNFVNLLDLLYSAAPPFTDPKVWALLLESLSTHPHSLKIVVNNPDNWKIHSWLLKQWGSIAPSVDNRLIRLWFPTTWPQLWRFLALPLPEEWHDMAITCLLDDTTLATPLPKPIIQSIEREHTTQLKNFLRRPLRSPSRRDTVVSLFNALVEGGYAGKMDLLHILITSDIEPMYVKNFMEAVFARASLTDEEIVQLLERYGSRFASYYQLPIVLEYARKYLLAFSINDLNRPSARQLLQFISNNSLLPQELPVLAGKWQAIAAFIDQPLINKQDLLALADAIHQLQSSTRPAVLDKLVSLCVSRVESEIELMCVISAMDNVLNKQDLYCFLYQIAEHVGEEYKRQRSESIFIPYIRVALQVDTVVHDISSSEQQEWASQFLEILLRHADKETYKKISAIVQNWPPRISARWLDYTSKRSSGFTTKTKRLWPWNSGPLGT